MKRRNFIIALVLSPMLFLTGCAPTDTQIAADGKAVAQALQSIAVIEQASNPTLAADLSTAATTLEVATANWSTGSSMAVINSAASAVEAVLAVIPQTAVVAPLVAVAVSALDLIVANTQVAPTANVKALNAQQQNNLEAFRLKGTTVLQTHTHKWSSLEGSFKSAWNSQAKTNPKLATAVIR
jgi:hypothetical protein